MASFAWLLLCLFCGCLASSSKAFNINEYLPAIQAYNSSFRVDRYADVSPEANILKEALILYFESLDKSFSSLSPATVKECLSFFVFTCWSTADKNVVKSFLADAFAAFKTDSSLLQVFVRDAAGGFVPNRFRIPPITESLMLLKEKEAALFSRAFLKDVLQYLEAHEITVESFDSLNFMFFFMGSSHAKYALDLNDVLSMMPFLPKISTLICDEVFHLMILPIAKNCEYYHKYPEFKMALHEYVLKSAFLDRILESIERADVKSNWIRIMSTAFDFVSQEKRGILSTEYLHLMEIFANSRKRSEIGQVLVRKELMILKEEKSDLPRWNSQYFTSMSKIHSALQTISRLFNDIFNEDLIREIGYVVFKVFKSCNDRLVINHISPIENLEYPILITFTASMLLARMDFQSSKCLFIRMASVVAGRGLRFYPESKFLKELLFDTLTPQIIAEIVQLLEISFNESTSPNWLTSEALSVIEFLKYVNIPQEKLTKFGVDLLPLVEWNDPLFFWTATVFLQDGPSEAFAIIVHKKINAKRKFTKTLDILIFLECCRQMEFMSATEIDFLKRAGFYPGVVMWFAGFLLLASVSCSLKFSTNLDHRTFRSNINVLAQTVGESGAVAALDMVLEHSPAIIEKVEEDASLESCLAPLVGALYPKLSVLPVSAFRGKGFNSVVAFVKVVFLGFETDFGSIQTLDRLVEDYGRCYSFLYLHKPRTTFSFPASLTKVMVAVWKPDVFSFLTIYWGHIIRAIQQSIKKKKVIRFQAEHIRFVMSLALECQLSGSILEQLLSEIDKDESILSCIWNFLDPSAFIQHIPELILANSSNPKLLFSLCLFVLDARSIQYFHNSESFDNAVKLFAGRQPFALADVLSFYKENRLVYDRLTNLCRCNLRQIAAARIVNSKMDSISAAVGTLKLNGFRTIRELKVIFDDLTVLDKANLGEIEKFSAILLDKPLKSVYERLIYIDPFEAEETQILIHRIRMVLALIKIKFRHFTPNGVDAAVAGAVSSYYSATLLFSPEYLTGDAPSNAKLKILSEAKRHNRLSSAEIDFLTLFLK